jgi:hypothetical protein
LNWPLEYISCGEIIPDQFRTQWGVNTEGARLDELKALRVGNSRNNLTLGFRTTDASSNSRLGPVERQRIGVASLTLGGQVEFRYWNDHAFWWWPLGDGGDKGDTAGVHFSYNLSPHQLSSGNWRLEHFDLTMRLATGIPDHNSVQPTATGQIYTEVEFPEVQRGDIGMSLHLRRSTSQKMEVGFTVDTSKVGEEVQNILVHRNLKIPELPKTEKVEVMVYLRITDW